jgi:hypothetical protein
MLKLSPPVSLLRPSLLLVVSLLSLPSVAEEYPNMVGVWKGHVRTVSSGSGVAGQVARGGAVISEIDLTVTFDHQDGETFIGKSRSSAQSRDQPSVPVWGAIRSTGTEAKFITGSGGRGDIWLMGPGKFEYCITNLLEGVITAYCGVLEKEK